MNTPNHPAHGQHPGPVGSMTAAMAAATGPDGHPVSRVLRVGVIQGTTLTREQIIRQRVAVTAGRTERCTLPVDGDGFPDTLVLFTVTPTGYALHLADGMEGRVALSDGVHTVADCRALAHRDGSSRWLALPETARGRVSLGGVTFLFQFVPAPPPPVRAQLPVSLRGTLSGAVDWRYNACLAAFLGLAVGALGWVEYGWDPEVSDDADAMELVSRSVRMDPTLRDTTPPPEPTEPQEPEAAAAAEPSTPASTPSPHPARPAADHGHPTAPTHSPAHPQTTAAVDRAQAAADRAVATALHGLNAHFAALTGPTGPHGTAVDQLANHALMDTTANDLRNTHGITTDGPSIQRTAGLVPGVAVQRLGENHLVASNTAVHTGTVADEPRHHGGFVTTPLQPVTDTCTGDATAVAHTLRAQLGGLRSCYERAVRDNPSLAGRVSLRFTVGGTGRATAVSVQGLSPALDTCLDGAVRRLVFPVPACGAADYEYPVVFDRTE